MGGLLQKLLLKVLPETSTADSSSAERQHVTAALGCCSTIRIDEHVDENAYHDKDGIAENDSSDLD